MSTSRKRSNKQRPGASVDPAPAAAAGSLWPPRRLIVSLCSLAAAALMVRAGLLEYVVGGIVDGAGRWQRPVAAVTLMRPNHGAHYTDEPSLRREPLPWAREVA
jgi:hypothetical protein